MTSELKKNYNVPLLGSLSLFDMNFASTGLSWAENIYQKLEKIYSDNDVMQVPCKYADAVGEHFRKMLDEVANDWLNPSDGCGDKSLSSLKHNVISEESKKSRVGLDETAVDEKLSACIEVESVVSSLEDTGLVTSFDVARDLGHQNTCGGYNVKSILNEATGSKFSDGVKEDYKSMESIVSSMGDLSLVTSLDVVGDLSQQNTHDEYCIKSIVTKSTGSKFSNGTGDDYRNVESINFPVEDLIKSISTGVTGSDFSDGAGANYKKTESIVCSVDYPILITSFDVPHDLSGKTPDEYGTKSISAEAAVSKFSDGSREDYKDVGLVVSSVGDWSLVTSAQDLSHQNTSGEYGTNLMPPEAIGLNFLDVTREDYTYVESVVSSVGDPSLVTSFDVSKNLSHQNLCDECSKNLISIGDTGSDFSEGAKENYKNIESIVFSVGYQSPVASCVVDQDLNQQNKGDECIIKSFSIETIASKFSDGTKENSKNVSYPVASLVDDMSSLASDEVHQSESYQNELREDRSMLSGFTSSSQIHDISDDFDREVGTIVADISDGFDRKVLFSSPDVVHPKTESVEAFEHINLDDGWDDNEKFELALISHYACKNKSYKRTLRRAFLSKLLPSKGRKRVENLHHGIDVGMQNRQRIDASSFSRGDQYPEKSAQGSCESDWVLLQLGNEAV